MIVCKVKDPISIKIVMAETGKSLREFSKQADISHPYLSQIMNGKRNPSPTVAYKIAKELDRDIEELFIIDTREKVTNRKEVSQ